MGEIINGVLHAHPRPAGPHALAGSRLGADIEGPYSRGKGGPGGWWIIDEPEVHFIRDTEVAVPDIAGWRKQRMPQVPEDHRFEIVPDWICEILSRQMSSWIAPRNCHITLNRGLLMSGWSIRWRKC